MVTAPLSGPRRVLRVLLAGVVVATTALTGALVAPATSAQAASPLAAPREDPLPGRIPATAPQNVRIATFADGGVLIEWDPPADWGNGENRSYDIRWQGSSSTSTTERVVYEPTSFQVGVTYDIVVSTYTNRGGTSAAPVQYTRTGRPQAPTAVTAVVGGPGTVAISWEAPVNTGGLPITRYDTFQRVVGSGDWIPGPSGIAPTARGAFATGLTIGLEYEFKVVASNSVGEGPDSGTARATVIDVPRPPTIQSYTVGDGRIDLTWNASLGVDSYAIEVNEGGSGYVEMATGITGTSGSVTGLVNGRTYDVRIGAINAAGRSASSSVQVQPLAPEVPGAPQALQATLAGPERVLLQWQAPVSDGRSTITSYIVQRLVEGYGWVGIAQPVGLSQEVGQDAGATVAYRVVAVNAVGQGAESDSVSIAAIVAPAAPQGLVPSQGDGTVTLTWTAVPSSAAAPVDGYVVEQRIPGGEWGAPTSVTIDGTSARITGLVNGTALEFRVFATNAAGRGAASATVTATPMAVPGAPLALQATVTRPSFVRLDWQPPASDGGTPVFTYVVERRATDDDPWQQAGLVPGTATQMSQTAGSTMQYRVSAFNALGAGAPSESVSITAIDTPAAPSDVQATPSDGTVSLSWSPVTSTAAAPVDDYVVEQRIAGGEWGAPAAVVVDGTTARITGLANGTALELRVVAINAAGRSQASTAVTATPIGAPGVPLALEASVAGPNAVELRWQPPTSDGGSSIQVYVIEGRETPESPWSIWTFTSATSATIGQGAGLVREYRVYAANEVGAGAPTSAVAVTAIRTPAQPHDVVTTVGDGSVTLSWTAVAPSTAAPVDGYVVEQRIGDGEWTAPTSVAIDGTSAVITGLANGTAVELRVLAVNAAGRGTPSATAAATPATVPGAPTAFELELGGSDAVQVRWQAPASDGGSPILDYVLERRLAGGEWQIRGSYPVGATVGIGQTAGTVVEYRVYAVNAQGAGEPTAILSITALRAPVAPEDLVAIAGDGSATLSWTPVASSDAAPVTGYEVQQRIDGGAWTPPPAVTVDVDGATASITGLANGVEVELRVRAENRLSGVWSEPVAVTPATVPDAPTALTAVAGDGTIALSWVAPLVDGGADVEGYVVEIRPVGAVDWTALTVDGTTALLSNLENGQAYELRVSAVNAAGAGNPTAIVTAVPITVPGAPTGLSATPGDAQATLTWVAPASTGGAAIDGYVVEQLIDDQWIAVDATIDGTAAVVRGLENGVVATFRVAAVNAAGTGAPSAEVEVSPFTIAEAPTGLVAVASDGQIVVSWQAPASSGGRDIVGYVVEQRVEGGEWTAATSTIAGTSVTLSEVANGVEVELRVAAVTEAGTGAFTAPVAATPFAFAPTVLGPNGAPLAGSTVRGGDVVTITADGLPAGARVVVELRSTPIELANVLIGADGTLRVQARIPADATVSAHELVVLLTGEDLVFATSVTAFSIEAAPVAPTPTAPAPSASAGSTSGGGPSHLPRTGAEALLPMLLLAFALLGAGVAVRRRTAVRER